MTLVSSGKLIKIEQPLGAVVFLYHVFHLGLGDLNEHHNEQKLSPHYQHVLTHSPVNYKSITCCERAPFCY